MPDVLCAQCGRRIELPQSYNFYDGNVRCVHCQATISVQLGEFRHNRYTSQVVRLTAPAKDSGEGGAILRQPEVVELGTNVPKELLHGTDAESIPDLARKTMRTALWNYREGRFDDAVVRCRVTLEAILKDQGIAEDTPSRMVERAVQDRLLPGHLGKLCEAVAAMGGRGAHAERPPIRQSEALLMIGIAAEVLRVYYLPDGE